ncbi:MAG TPA: radical SAM protein [Clostridiaceae bacterium]|nr:radical SAM protein [Clostridiaceae bacterium]
MKTKHFVIPVFVPHKGCPFDCIYCNQKKISGQVEEMTEDNMRSTIETHLASIGNGSFVEIGFYGGSFTGIEKDQQLKLLKIANEYIEKGKVQSIRLSTRPDYINDDILNYLKEYRVETIELGVQSLDEDVLRKSCRGHSVNDVITSSRHIKNYGFKLGIQTMIGLPGDSKLKDIYTAKKVVELKPDIVRIYPTLVIKGTMLERMYYNKEYVPLSLEEAVEICADLIQIYEENDIIVIRVGLQPTENINEYSENSDVVAGPFHPALRQLVESRVFLKKINEFIIKNKLEKEKGIIIYTSTRYISSVVGQKRANIRYLKEKYAFREIKVRGSENLGKEILVENMHTDQ